MNRSFALALFAGLALSLSGAACGGRVDSGSGTNQNGVQGEAGSSSIGPASTGPRGGVNAIAISIGKLDAYDWGTSSASTGSGGGGPDPSTIILQATNATYTCHRPAVPVCTKRTVWEVGFDFPPNALVPGTYGLSEPWLKAFYDISGPNGGGECGGGGGPFVQGQLVVDQVDATTVHFRLVGTNQNDSFDGLDSDGSYVALRCN
jgi:hypothetical protein